MPLFARLKARLSLRFKKLPTYRECAAVSRESPHIEDSSPFSSKDTQINVSSQTTECFSIGGIAEQTVPALFQDAIHDPEVLGIRTSLVIGSISANVQIREALPVIIPTSSGPGVDVSPTESQVFAPLLSPSPIANNDVFAHDTVNTPSITLPEPSVYKPAYPFLQLHDFRQVRGIGHGGFGDVYLAEHLPTGLRVAFKAIKKEHAEHTAVLAEQRALKQLATNDKRGLLKFLGSYHNEQHYFFLSEYCSGGTLGRVISRWGRLPRRLVKHYAAEALLAIEAVHDQGWLHRDIKPENFFLDSQGHLVLGDFGFAVSVTPPGQTYEKTYTVPILLHETCGTWEYVAPEMWNMEEYSFSVDIWAFAVTLFRMMFGRLPWTRVFGEPYEIMAQRTLDGSLDRWLGRESLDATAYDLLQRLFEKDPWRRITLDNIKAHPFFKDIAWDEISLGKVPVPDIGSPLLKTPCEPGHPDTDIIYGSFGGGGVYSEGKDPSPSFNYISSLLQNLEWNTNAHKDIQNDSAEGFEGVLCAQRVSIPGSDSMLEKGSYTFTIEIIKRPPSLIARFTLWVGNIYDHLVFLIKHT